MKEMKITSQGIIDEAKKLLHRVSISHKDVLKKLLTKIKKIDFHEKANIDPDDKINQRQMVVIAIDEILELAKQNKWGICKNNGGAYLFNGEYWKLLEEDMLKTFLGEASRKLGVERILSRHFDFRNKLLNQFDAVASIHSSEHVDGKVLINLKNGTLEITEDGPILLNFNSDDFLKYQLQFRYDPYATAPMFQQFLNKVLPYDDLQNILAEFIGYIFIPTSKLKLEKALLLYGNGANGKSVFFDIINALLGRENISTYSLANLTDKTGYHRAMIGDKLLNYASEINSNMDTAAFKMLVSGEPIEARLPYVKPMIIEDYAKFIFNANDLPKDVEHNNAFFRRFIIIPFNVTIPEDEQDKTLAQKIISAELPGILNWALAGLQRLTSQGGFTESNIVQNELEEYKKESDSVYLFVDEYGYIPDVSETCPLKEMYSNYKSYCYDNNFYTVSNKSFRKRLEAINFKTSRKSSGLCVYARTNLNPL